MNLLGYVFPLPSAPTIKITDVATNKKQRKWVIGLGLAYSVC